MRDCLGKKKGIHLDNMFQGIMNIRQAGRLRARHSVDVTWWRWGMVRKILCERWRNKNLMLAQAFIFLLGEHKGTIMSDALIVWIHELLFKMFKISLKTSTKTLFFCRDYNLLLLYRNAPPAYYENVTKYMYVIRKVRTVCAYLSRIFETVTLRMFSDFLYQLRSHRRHFVKFVLCLCLFPCVKHV